MEYSKNNSSKLKILKVYLHLNELFAPFFGTPFGKSMDFPRFIIYYENMYVKPPFVRRGNA
jgi:hypothetical protein